MQVGVGLHMSHAWQKLEILGGFKTPIFSKNVFLGEKKGISAPKLQSEGDFFFHYLRRTSYARFGAHMSHLQQILRILGGVNLPPKGC